MAAFPDHRLHLFTRTLSASSTPNLEYLLYSALVVSVLLPVYRFIVRDYHDFLSLGPGGTPSTFAGYLRVSCLRLFILKDPFTPPTPTPATLPTDGYLLRLPIRAGPRPTVAGIAPQRQLNQKSSPQLHQLLRDALHSLVAIYPTMLRKGKSCFEKHGLALFMASSLEFEVPPMTLHPSPSHVNGLMEPFQTPSHLNPTCADTAEICHLHASDSSMHLTLHPSDAALVIAMGWGERHPLAGRLIFGRRLLPSGFVMVYAPQDETQVGILLEVVRAGGWWVGGVALRKGPRGLGVLTRGERWV